MSADGAPRATQTNVDIMEILYRIPHRYPFLLIDRAEDYRPHESIVGIKCVTVNEPFFVGHFPGNPVMPGVLIIEALAQTGAVLMSKSLDVDVTTKTIMFMSVDAARFRSPVRPGDVLRLHVDVARVTICLNSTASTPPSLLRWAPSAPWIEPRRSIR